LPLCRVLHAAHRQAHDVVEDHKIDAAQILDEGDQPRLLLGVFSGLKVGISSWQSAKNVSGSVAHFRIRRCGENRTSWQRQRPIGIAGHVVEVFQTARPTRRIRDVDIPSRDSEASCLCSSDPRADALGFRALAVLGSMNGEGHGGQLGMRRLRPT
jgi:hypothetical protein